MVLIVVLEAGEHGGNISKDQDDRCFDLKAEPNKTLIRFINLLVRSRRESLTPSSTLPQYL